MRLDNNEIANSFIELLEVLRKLRAPGGCSWDQKQTSQSLIPYLLEETHEIIEAIETKNLEALKEELGDLMLHILFQSEIATEEKNFNIIDSLQNITKKLIQRHPNVFNQNNEQTQQPKKVIKACLRDNPDCESCGA